MLYIKFRAAVSSASFFLAAHLFLLNFTNIYLVYTAMTLFGISIAIGYFSLLRNSWKYYPERKGLITGIILCSYGLASTIYTSICEYIVNPKEVKPISEDFYEEEVAQKMFYFILILTITFSLGSVLSVIMISPHSNLIQIKSNSLDEKTPYLDELVETKIKENNILDSTLEIEQKQDLIIALKSRQFILIVSMAFCINCKIN